MKPHSKYTMASLNLDPISEEGGELGGKLSVGESGIRQLSLHKHFLLRKILRQFWLTTILAMLYLHLYQYNFLHFYKL